MSELIDRLLLVPLDAKHPECGPDEIFICYQYRSVAEKEMVLPGKRYGVKAFLDDQDVTEMARAHDVVPVFANRGENAKRYAQPA